MNIMMILLNYVICIRVNIITFTYKEIKCTYIGSSNLI